MAHCWTSSVATVDVHYEPGERHHGTNRAESASASCGQPAMDHRCYHTPPRTGQSYDCGGPDRSWYYSAYGLWVRAAVIASIIWALIVWYGGEGMSMLFTGQAGFLTGAPGGCAALPTPGPPDLPTSGGE